MKRTLITGITGQDGSYLAEFLLSKGYEVHGLIRRSSTPNTGRIEHIHVDPHLPKEHFYLHHGDMGDSGQLMNLVYNICPDEIYNLAAQSHVKVSFEMPEYTGDSTGLGTTRLLEAIRRSGITTRYYQASSSELFGDSPPPQNEKTPFLPRSPYAAAKIYAYWMTVNYREGYGLFACNGILFNHESPRRGETFVTRKITLAVANILKGNQIKLYLGNLDARRDWGFAPEYVEMMWLMLQQEIPDDYVVATGECYSVREFVDRAFAYTGVQLAWQGRGIDEVGVVASSSWGHLAPGTILVQVDPEYYRPTEVAALQADISKARQKLGWSPKVTFDELVKIMMDCDLRNVGLSSACDGLAALRCKGFDYSDHIFATYGQAGNLSAR